MSPSTALRTLQAHNSRPHVEAAQHPDRSDPASPGSSSGVPLGRPGAAPLELPQKRGLSVTGVLVSGLAARHGKVDVIVVVVPHPHWPSGERQGADARPGGRST